MHARFSRTKLSFSSEVIRCNIAVDRHAISSLGFIGVVLRGQRLDEHGRASKELDIPGALEHERQFFINDSAYR